ncbi:MAG: NAD(P)H-dependent oxidoreductase [Pseudomonadales bacterium]
MKHLLIVYHSKTGATERLARAVEQGARHPDAGDVDVRLRRASDAGPDDLLWAHAVLLGTPENFGYMSGALKDFFDRTFYEVEGRLSPLPCALFIAAGNDGTGAVRAIRRIIGGYPLREVQEPLIVRGAATSAQLAAAHDLGLALAAGLEAGIY